MMNQELVELVISGEAVSAKSRNMTLKGFLISIGVSLLIFVAYTLSFCFLRKRLRSIYEPRTFIKAKGVYVTSTTVGFFSWITPVFNTANTEIMHTLGLDAYFFLRFVLFLMSFCGALGVPFLITLIPLHFAMGTRKGIKGLDKLSILNLADEQNYLHVAHLLLCLFCMIISMFVFNFELKNYFRLRAEHIINRNDDDISGSSSTILMKEIDQESCSEEAIRLFFDGASIHGSGPSAIEKIWFNRDYSHLHRLVTKRTSVVNSLELKELWVLEKCLCDGVDQDWRNGNKDSTITGNLWREYMSPDHLGDMYGEHGSSITWLKGELNRLNSEIYTLQTREELSPVANSCFVQFKSNLSAFVASRSLITSKTLGNRVKIYGKVYPADIIWSNLSATTWQRRVCKLSSIAINYMFIFGWAIPVALISIATQVDTMAKWMPQVHWAANSPRTSYLMTSVMTPILVSSVTSFIPFFFRVLSKLKGFPTNTLVEMDVQNYLFLFMFFQLFLIVTISSGLPALVITTLVNTSEGAMTLANSLPKATTFFISYVMASSLTTAGNSFLQSQQLFMSVWYRLFSRTPREKFRTRYVTSTIYWGSVFPLVTNVASIAIAYALISPIILLSAVMGLGALYVAFKYRIVYCYIPRCIADGDYYPKAIFQLFAGFYCQQISLLGSLLVSGQVTLAALAALIIVATIISHRHLRSMFVDLKTRIPVREVVLEETANLDWPETRRMPKNNRDEPSLPGTPGTALSEVTLAEVCSPPGSGVGTYNTPIGMGGSSSVNSPSSSTASCDTWKHLFGTMGLDFTGLTPGQQQHISTFLFEHPDRWQQRPCVWLPTDGKGVAHDQVEEMQHYFTDLRCSCEGASISQQGKVTISQAPPDFDPRKLMRM